MCFKKFENVVTHIDRDESMFAKFWVRQRFGRHIVFLWNPKFRFVLCPVIVQNHNACKDIVKNAQRIGD